MNKIQQSNIDLEKDEKLSKISQQLLSISQGTSTVIGEKFFENLAQCLAATFQVRYAFIGKVIDFEKNIAQMSPLWDDVGKEFNSSIVWNLKNTPCEDVVLRETRLVPKNVQESYPLAPILKKFNIDSYFGIPLISPSGKRLGLISVMDDKPMTDTENYEQIIQIFANRCVCEMERLEIDSKLKDASISKNKSDSNLSDIAKNTTSVIYMKNLEGRYLFINKRWENIFKVTSQEVLGKTDLDLFPKEIAEKFIKIDQQIMRSGETFEGEEFAPHDDGLHTYISIKSPLKDSKGVVYGMCGVSTDITDRKKVEDKLKRSNEELERFTFTASHDLKEPLRKIVTFGDMLKEFSKKKLGCEETIYVEKIQKAAFRMNELIDDLLNYSMQIQNDECFKLLNLNALIQEVTEDLEVQISETMGDVQVHSLPEIEADKIQMRQLFQNLIANGLKFRRSDVPIKIVVKNCGVDNGLLKIIIEDNGIGIDMKYAERIFEPFQRLKDVDSEGSGMGLFICRKIAHRHHGSISVQGSKNEGATFKIELPTTQQTNIRLPNLS